MIVGERLPSNCVLTTQQGSEADWARCPWGSCQHVSLLPLLLPHSGAHLSASHNLVTHDWGAQLRARAEGMAAPIIVFIFILFLPGRSTLECFKCVSINGNNPPCDDPFHNNFSSSIIENPCMGGRKGRNGVFPASACIKLKGTFGDNGQQMVVRGCALDSGTLTVDTELVRMSHCGGFYYDERYVSGCVQSCVEEGCNGQIQSRINWSILGLSFFVSLICFGCSESVP